MAELRLPQPLFLYTPQQDRPPRLPSKSQQVTQHVPQNSSTLSLCRVSRGLTQVPLGRV